MPRAFAFFLTNIGFTLRTSICSVNACGRLRAQDPCVLPIVIFMDRWNVGFSGCVEPRCRHRGGRDGLPGRELRRRACGLRCYGEPRRCQGQRLPHSTGRRHCRRCAAAARRPARRPGRGTHQLGAGNFFPGGQAPAQSIAGGSGKVRLGQTSACLAPARSSSASRRRRAASIRIDCGASLRHERLESALCSR
jgi:hypothetical protein